MLNTKNKFMKTILFISTITLLLSCSNSQNSNSTISIDLDASKSISINNIFSKMEIIPLETNEKSKIQNIDKIIEYQSFIYILDRRQKAVLIFDSHGKFISKINTIGRAPDEFYLLEDIVINRFANTLECLDPMGKILTYSLQGQYQSSIYLPHPPMAYHYLHILNQDSILLYTNPTKYNDYTFRIFSRQQDTFVSQFMKQKKIINGECRQPIQVYKDSIYFTQAFSNEIYKISNDTLLPAYQWDFGKYTYNLSKMKFPDLTNPEEQIKFYKEVMYSSKIPYTLGFNSQNDRYLFCSLFMKNKILNILYDKTTKRKVVFSKSKEDIGLYPLYMDNNKIIGITDETLVPLEPLENTQNIEIIKKEIIYTLTDYSNPILIKYFFK